MSTGIRWSARPAPSAMAIRATTTVIGRVRAASTKFILLYLSESLACLDNKRLNVPGRGGDTQQPAPDAETCQRIINLCLSQQPLGVCYLINRSKPRFISGSRLLRRTSRSRNLYGRVGGNPPASLEAGYRSIPLGAQIGGNLFEARGFRADCGRLHGLTRSNRGEIKNRKNDTESQAVILNVGCESIQPAQPGSIDFGTRAAGVGRSLSEEAGKV